MGVRGTMFVARVGMVCDDSQWGAMGFGDDTLHLLWPMTRSRDDNIEEDAYEAAEAAL